MACVTYHKKIRGYCFSVVIVLYSNQQAGQPGWEKGGAILKILADPARKARMFEAHKLADYMTLDINRISDLVCFERNEYLVTAGIPSDYLYFVISGKTICFSYTSNEKNNCVSFTQHQTLVGEASSLFGKPPAFNVKALSDTVCIAINLPRYRADLLNDLTFVRNVCELLASKINNEGRYSTTLLDPLEVRLAQFILLNTANHLFTLQLTDCADALNTSYRHLLQIMKQLCALGILSKEHNCYYIQDRDALLRISSGEMLLSE